VSDAMSAILNYEILSDDVLSWAFAIQTL